MHQRVGHSPAWQQTLSHTCLHLRLQREEREGVCVCVCVCGRERCPKHAVEYLFDGCTSLVCTGGDDGCINAWDSRQPGSKPSPTPAFTWDCREIAGKPHTINAMISAGSPEGAVGPQLITGEFNFHRAFLHLVPGLSKSNDDDCYRCYHYCCYCYSYYCYS